MADRLLIVDDEENMRHLLFSVTSRAGFEVALAVDGRQALAAVQKDDYDFVLCDLKMPGLDGISFLQQFKAIDTKDTVVIMMSAYGTIDSAVEAMNLGAFDFITKPFKSGEVVLVLQKAAERVKLRRENLLLKKQVFELQGRRGFEAIITGNAAMLALIDAAGKVARYKTSVLITGESGTGKELFARGIHQASPRKNKSFVAVNCGSIPAELLESEFFGYRKGAFTGADTDRKGLFEQAHQGTLFLDEIGELPAALQVKFLRVLQEEEVRPLGAAAAKKVDVRIIAATAKNLEEEVAENRFRNDLFYRLNVAPFHLPPLRERMDDLPRLAEHFVEKINNTMGCKIKEVADEALQKLMHYDWPGNIRELENTVERAAVLAGNRIIEAAHLPEWGRQTETDMLLQELGTSSLKKAKIIIEKRLIAEVLHSVAGNKSRAADILEISYPSLLTKIKEYGL